MEEIHHNTKLKLEKVHKEIGILNSMLEQDKNTIRYKLILIE